MKKAVQKALVLIAYLFFLLNVTGFQWNNILDLKGLCLVIIGMLLLSLPQWMQKQRDRRGRQRDRKEVIQDLLQIFSWNALFASYIATIVTLMARLYRGVAPEQVTREIALGCRPVLYGLLLYIFFHGEWGSVNKEPPPKEPEGNNRAEKIDAEQLCYFFRAKGLTARESEVASLLYQGHSNRVIAEKLYIAETTVKKHVTHILEKLKIEHRGQIREIVRDGLNLSD